MRYRFPLAMIAGLMLTGWPTPILRADDAAQLEKIMEQITHTLEQADLPAAAKESLLRDLKQNLSKSLSSAAAQPPTAAEQTQAPSPASEADTETDAEAEDTAGAEANQAERDRARQQARAAQRERRREQRREAAAPSRRGESPRDEPWQRRGIASPDPAPQPVRFAIGVMLEKSDEDGSEGKLVITDVFPGSPAAEAELQSGDVILQLDGEELTDAAEVTRRVDQAGREKKSLTLEIGRDDEQLTVEVTPTARLNLAFEFARPDWAFPAAPGMPGFGGWWDPQWQVPTPPRDRDSNRVREIIERIERQEQVIEQMQRTIEELRQQRAADPQSEADDGSEDD